MYDDWQARVEAAAKARLDALRRLAKAARAIIDADGRGPLTLGPTDEQWQELEAATEDAERWL